MTNDDVFLAEAPPHPEMRPGSYCLISPCRDEAQYARRTLDAVSGQTIPPALWIIVDDGSTDATPDILREYEARLPYLRVVRLDDRGYRHVGAGVMQAFYAGIDAIGRHEWQSFEFICKLDLDLDFPPGYFQEIIKRMTDEPRIGTASGSPYFTGPDGRMISEMCGRENSVGMIKFYRRSAWEQVGGFIRELTWDAIDCHICRLHGWYARSWDDVQIRIHHLRPMGSSQKSWWTGRIRHGRGQWYMGTSVLYMLVSGLFRMTRPPLMIGGIGIMWGYFHSMMTRAPQFPDPKVRRFVKRYQYACLFLGKNRATAWLDRRQQAVWAPNHSINTAKEPRTILSALTEMPHGTSRSGVGI